MDNKVVNFVKKYVAFVILAFLQWLEYWLNNKFGRKLLHFFHIFVDDYDNVDEMSGCEWRRWFWLGRSGQLSEEGKPVKSE